MHELSIVMSISDIARDEVIRANARSVERIELIIGKLAGIEFSSFDFAWLPGTKGTVLEHSECVIEKVDGQAHCMDCDHEFRKEDMFQPCPSCGGYLHDIIKGKELMVKRLILNS